MSAALPMALVDVKTREVLVIGQLVETFRGDVGTLVGWERPRHAGSTGRVTVKVAGDGGGYREWYPGVIGAEWTQSE